MLLAAVSGALGLTSLAYKVLDDQRITLVGILLTFAFLLQFGSYLASVDRPVPDPADATSFLRSLLVHRRRLIEVLVDFALITASFTLAFMIRVEGPGLPGVPWHRHVFALSLPAILVARYIVFVLAGFAIVGIFVRDTAAAIGGATFVTVLVLCVSPLVHNGWLVAVIAVVAVVVGRRVLGFPVA